MEEQIAFTVFAIILGTLGLSFFKINPLLAVGLAIVSVGFWWTLFFVFFG